MFHVFIDPPSGAELRQFPDALVLVAQPPQADAQAERPREVHALRQRLLIDVPDLVGDARFVDIGEVRALRSWLPIRA